jgi:hypothetical protein
LTNVIATARKRVGTFVAARISSACEKLTNSRRARSNWRWRWYKSGVSAASFSTDIAAAA